jgi:hypothetical protein
MYIAMEDNASLQADNISADQKSPASHLNLRLIIIGSESEPLNPAKTLAHHFLETYFKHILLSETKYPKLSLPFTSTHCNFVPTSHQPHLSLSLD